MKKLEFILNDNHQVEEVNCPDDFNELDSLSVGIMSLGIQLSKLDEDARKRCIALIATLLSLCTDIDKVADIVNGVEGVNKIIVKIKKSKHVN